MGKARDSKKAQAAADAAAAAKAALVALSSEGELTPPARLLYPYDAYERFHAYDQLTDPPCGLTNCGNSCFGAAALNCLAFTRPMVAFCLRKPGQPSGAPDHTEATCGEPGWCFLCQLQRHVKKAMGRKTAFAPVDIVSKVRQLGRHLSFGAEEDAHDFFYQMLDAMHTIALKEAGGEKRHDPTTQQTSLVYHMFGGYTRSQVLCMVCKHASNRYESMLDLCLHITDSNITSIDSALSSFVEPEWLDGDNKYQCDRCDAKVRARRALRIHVAPNVLVLQLKRLGVQSKSSKAIQYSATLDLAHYMSEDGDGDDAGSAQYSLYAVIVHQELSTGLVTGHYMCFVRLSDDRWFKCDDGEVSEVSQHTALKQEAYMLFYQRHKPRAAPSTAPRARPGVPSEPLKRSKPLSQPEVGTRTPQHTVTQHGSQTDVYGAEQGVQWPTQLRLSVQLPGVTSVTKVKTKMRFDCFTMRVKGQYSLQVMLPYPVEPDDESAQFTCSNSTFTVTVPVCDYVPPGWQSPTSLEQQAEAVPEAEAEAEQERATSSTGASVESCGGAQQGKQDVAAAGAVGADVDMGVRGQERAAREAEVARGERAVAEQQVQAKEEEVEYITPDWCPAITTNPKTGFKQWEMVVEVPALKTETTKAKLVWLDEMQQAGVLHLTVYPYRLHLPLKQLGMPAGFDFYSSTVECAIKRTAGTLRIKFPEEVNLSDVE